MSKICKVCDKSSVMVVVRKKLRGKYNPTTKKRKYPNLQWLAVDGKRVKACAQCIRTASKTK